MSKRRRLAEGTSCGEPTVYRIIYATYFRILSVKYRARIRSLSLSLSFAALEGAEDTLPYAGAETLYVNNSIYRPARKVRPIIRADFFHFVPQLRAPRSRAA